MSGSELPTPPPLQQHHFITVLAVAGTALITYILSTREDPEKLRIALESTISAQMEKFGKSTQARGNVLSEEQILAKAKEAMGNELLRHGVQNGSINAVVTALAEVQGRLQTIEQNQLRQRADGTYETTIAQKRDNLAPLTEVNLSFDPKNPGSTFRSQWSNNTERFTASFAQWRTSADGARAAVTLERKVFKNNTQIGETEVLPITNNEAYFSKDAIAHIAPFPKYTFNVLTSIDTNSGAKGYWLGSTKWFTREVGVTLGYSKTGPNKQINFGAAVNVGKQ